MAAEQSADTPATGRFVTLRRMTILILALVAALLGTVLVLLWRESWGLTNPAGYVHPRKADFRFETTPLSALDLPYEDVEIAAPDGGVVRGWLIPSPNSTTGLAVVAVHGRGGDRTSHLRHVPILREAGAAVALVDLRENGLSDGQGRGTALAMREADDALAVAKDLRGRGYRRIVLFGCSLGGSAALIAAATDPDIAGVIAESPIESFSAYIRDGMETRLRGRGLNARWAASIWGEMVVGLTRLRLGLMRFKRPIDVVGTLAPRPTLIMHGEQDHAVFLAHARNLAERAGPNARLVTFSNGGHCSNFEASAETYANEVSRLLISVANGPDLQK